MMDDKFFGSYSLCFKVVASIICDLSRKNVAYAEIINFEKTGVFITLQKIVDF